MTDARHGSLGAAALFAFVLFGAGGADLVAQKARGKPALAPTKATTPLGDVRILDKKTMANLEKRLKASVLSKKAKRGPLADRLQELEGLDTMQHERLVSILHKVMTRDPSTIVRAKAARALVAQPASKVLKIAMVQVKDRSVLAEGTLAEPMIRILSYYGAPAKVWKGLRSRFVDIGVNAQKAFLEHVAAKKDWDSVPLLVANLDAPAPADVNSASNPPASYWKMRWDKWKVFRPHVLTALQSILGRSFENAKDARAFIEKNGGFAKMRRAAAKAAKKKSKK